MSNIYIYTHYRQLKDIFNHGMNPEFIMSNNDFVGNIAMHNRANRIYQPWDSGDSTPGGWDDFPGSGSGSDGKYTMETL